MTKMASIKVHFLPLLACLHSCILADGTSTLFYQMCYLFNTMRYTTEEMGYKVNVQKEGAQVMKRKKIGRMEWRAERDSPFFLP